MDLDFRYLFGLLLIVISKTAQRFQAVKLRKKGFSYSEILETVHVSQSSLSLWLHSIKLDRKQKLRLTHKSDLARKRGSQTLKNNRIARTVEIIEKAKSEIGILNNKQLMLIGIALYWAEGSKQKDHDPSKELVFSNSDPKMIRLYLKWLTECLFVPVERIVFEIYIHKSHKKSPQDLAKHWSEITGFTQSKFVRVYFKKNKIHSIRKNRGTDYSGVLRISVTKSTDLNRKVQGWIQGICLTSGVVGQNTL